MAHAGESVIQPRLVAAPAYEPPTERELEVPRLLAAAQSNKEIGRALGLALAEGTVKNHVSTILDKLQAANRTRAALVARDAGLI